MALTRRGNDDDGAARDVDDEEGRNGDNDEEEDDGVMVATPGNVTCVAHPIVEANGRRFRTINTRGQPGNGSPYNDAVTRYGPDCEHVNVTV
jgi:hypothetical protein